MLEIITPWCVHGVRLCARVVGTSSLYRVEVYACEVVPPSPVVDRV
jgi:hypothetical protein